ncbi:hypothetical protein BLNAU_2465 [Blattamonas nauphoetae]|uniref:Protein kinase domain-containing protein n=1 Tax=Blattamonas nauphoetae TaxID=2049346 RepID=A0ABQ9YFV2_9EUKA|nr:hypothetical protein BLNAU_2465 [Blattamonas nauphoetae]
MTSVDTTRNRNKMRFSSSGTIRREDQDNIPPSLRHVNLTLQDGPAQPPPSDILQTLKPCSDPPPPEPTPPSRPIRRDYEGSWSCQAHTDTITSMKFDPLSLTLHRSENKTVCVVDSATMELVERLKGHTPILESVAFDEQRDRIIRLDVGGCVVLYSLVSYLVHYNHHSTLFLLSTRHISCDSPFHQLITIDTHSICTVWFADTGKRHSTFLCKYDEGDVFEVEEDVVNEVTRQSEKRKKPNPFVVPTSCPPSSIELSSVRRMRKAKDEKRKVPTTPVLPTLARSRTTLGVCSACLISDPSRQDILIAHTSDGIITIFSLSTRQKIVSFGGSNGVVNSTESTAETDKSGKQTLKVIGKALMPCGLWLEVFERDSDRSVEGKSKLVDLSTSTATHWNETETMIAFSESDASELNRKMEWRGRLMFGNGLRTSNWMVVSGLSSGNKSLGGVGSKWWIPVIISLSYALLVSVMIVVCVCLRRKRHSARNEHLRNKEALIVCNEKMERSVAVETDTLFNALHNAHSTRFVEKGKMGSAIARGLVSLKTRKRQSVILGSSGIVSGGMKTSEDDQRWMAPEVLQENWKPTLENADHGAVFSLGLVLWEIETGSVPFGEVDGATAQRRLASDEKPVMEKVSSSMEAIILPCLSLDPSLRPTQKNRSVTTGPTE